MRVAVLSAGGGAWGAGGAGSAAPEEVGPNMRVNSPACWNGLLSGGADWAALACSFSISMDSPESREPNKRSNWPVSGEASLADDAGHGEPGAAGGNDPPERRATGGGADGGGGGLNSVRGGRKAMAEAASEQWMKRQLKASYEPLLQEPWVLDVDTTVKPLYGHQQDAKVGYN